MQHEDPDAPRPLGEVMLDAVHNADVLMRSLRDVRLRVARDEPVSGEDVDRLVRMSQVAHALAETTVRAGVQVALVREAQVQTELNSTCDAGAGRRAGLRLPGRCARRGHHDVVEAAGRGARRRGRRAARRLGPDRAG